MKNDKFQIQQMVLEKTPTGNKGLDEIPLGGLSKGRQTLVYGNAGCGIAIDTWLMLRDIEFEKDEAKALKVIAIGDAKSKLLVIEREEMATYHSAEAR